MRAIVVKEDDGLSEGDVNAILIAIMVYVVTEPLIASMCDTERLDEISDEMLNEIMQEERDESKYDICKR